MKLHRVQAIILRFFYLFKRSMDRWSDAFYWPMIDLLLWGITTSYFSQTYADPTITQSVLFGLLLWILVWRGQYELSINLLEEIWNKNLINLFVSPLRFREWIAGLLSLGIIKGLISLAFAVTLAWLFFRVSLFDLGPNLLVFIPLLFLNGWWMGFLITGIIMRFGTKVQNFAWTMTWALSPFTAIYFPLEILPKWAQQIAMFVPASYIFEAERGLLKTGVLDWDKIAVSLLLTCLYLILTYVFLYRSYQSVLMKKGLIKLY